MNRDVHREKWLDIVDEAFALDDDDPFLSAMIDAEAPADEPSEDESDDESEQNLAGEWDESLHPRDDGGQFTEGGGDGGSSTATGSGTDGGRRGSVSSATAPQGKGRPAPNPDAQSVANDYNRSRGLSPVDHSTYAQVDQEQARTIADEFDALPDNASDDPRVREAYAALATEVNAQWDHIVASGMTLEPWTQEGQPYQSSREMAEDVRQNKHMYFYQGGEPHPLLSDPDPNTGLSVNDKFRAVHDYFGHAAGGYGFGPRGEENAWISHSKMLTLPARRALTTETRGQNSWVNFGRHNYNEDGSYKNIPPPDRPYAIQKAAILPDKYVLLPGETTSLSYRQKLANFSRGMMLDEDFESKHPRDEAGKFAEGEGGGGGGEGASSGSSGSTGSSTGSSLTTGTPVHAEKLGGNHSNEVVLVELEDGTKAVFKPEVGEAWNMSFANSDINEGITNRNLSLAEREAMTAEVDSIVGTELVPETVLRESFDVGEVGASGEDSGGYDEDELRDMYHSYREEQQDHAYEVAGERMAELYAEEANDHLQKIEQRAQEIGEVWNEVIDEHPEYGTVGPYGSRTEVAIHPTLPMGTEQGIPVQGFERAAAGYDDKNVNPISVIDEASVNIDGPLNDTERSAVKSILEGKLAAGAQTLLTVDEDAGREHLDRDEFYKQHQDTEQQYIDSAIPSFDSWRNRHGYEIAGSDDSGIRYRNSEAPHETGGSLQRFVPNLNPYGDLDADRGDHHRFAVLDYMAGSMDRHGSNVFHTEDEKPLGMDNGYTFPNRNGLTLRSQPVYELLNYGRSNPDVRVTPPELRERWKSNIDKTDWNAFVARHPSMDAGEKEAFLERVNDMSEALSEPEGLYDLWRSRSDRLMR